MTEAPPRAMPHSDAPMSTIEKNSAAARLVSRVLEAGEATLPGLAAALGVPAGTLEDYAAVRERMPLSLQVKLALVVEQDVPRFARDARRLRAQALAAAAMTSGATICHARPPEGWK